jgi:hypothetical protein
LLESSVEIRETFEAAGIAGGGYALPGQQHLFGLVDPVVIDELGKGQPGHFLEVTTKSRRTQVTQFSDFRYADATGVILIDKAVDAVEPGLVPRGILILHFFFMQKFFVICFFQGV